MFFSPRSIALTLSLSLVAFGVSASRGAAPDLLVASQGSSQILRYNGTTGAPMGVFAQNPAMDGPESMAYGPDGNLYVASGFSGNVTKFSGYNGSFMGTFIPNGTAGLTNPASLAFGPDGNLYVLTHSTSTTQAIWKFDGGTGAFISKFGTNGGGDGTNAASTNGLAFDSAGHLWQGRRTSDSIIEFDSSGAQLSTIVDDNNLAVTSSLAFGPDGNLYVANVSPGGVARYNASTGQFMDFFVPSGTATWGLSFSADNKLYVGFTGDNHVERYNATTGQDMGQFIAALSGGMNGPFSFAFAPEPASTALLLVGFGVASLRRARR